MLISRIKESNLFFFLMRWKVFFAPTLRLLGSFLKFFPRDLVHFRQNIINQNLHSIGTRGKLSLWASEMSVFSQNGEDGILFEIFQRLQIDVGNFIEIGCSYHESNCIFLAEMLGWNGTFIDGSKYQSEKLKNRFKFNESVTVLKEFVTPENINIVTCNSDAKNLDLLSLDVDGNEYYLFEKLDVKPKCIVIEYNSSHKIDPEFIQKSDVKKWDGTAKFGVGHKALEKLAKSKGYEVVYYDYTGVNAFLIREDLLDLFPERKNLVRRTTNIFARNFTHR